jgi:alpha-mannosidase
LSKKINTNLIKDGKPFVVFNPLSWERSEICYLDLPKEYSEKNFKIIDEKKQEIPFQIIEENKKIAFSAKNIPSIGYKVFYLVESKTPADFKGGVKISNGEIENDFFKVKVDSKTGNISSIFDKINNKEVLKSEGNLLQIFEDKPLYYDAWEIRYTGKKWELDETKGIKITESGPLVGKIRVSKDFLGDGKSRRIPTAGFPSSFFTQDVTLYDGVPRIDINMGADWWEEHKLLKASFPVNVENKKATYEIPNAAVERPTTRNNNWEKARYEVPALQWADLSDNNYGVSLLNNSKYGYDIEGNRMRLTLLRAPTSPDPNADRGKHKFTYSIYPHKGDWKEAGTVQKGYELNNPMVVQFVERSKGELPLSYSMLGATGNNIIILAVKKAESGNAIIVRLYESTGKPYTGNITLPFMPKSVSEVDLLERLVSELKFNMKTLSVTLKPFETKTIKIEY